MQPVENNLFLNYPIQFNIEKRDPDSGLDALTNDLINEVYGNVIAREAIPFPDSDASNGNSQLWLEQTLLILEDKGDLKKDERDEALRELIENPEVKIDGKLLKEDPNRPASSVIADTYKNPKTGKLYYKFLMTWEIETPKIGAPIQCKQWIITGIEQPNELSDPESIKHRHHIALLAVKCYRHIHKAAFNHKHADYLHICDCIDDVRSRNLVGIEEFAKGQLRFSSHPLDLDNSISVNQSAMALEIVLKDAKKQKRNIYIDQSKTGRIINEEGSKYLKAEPDDSNVDVIPLALKRIEQAHCMAVRGNADLEAHLNLLYAKPEQVEELIKDSAFIGKNARGLDFLEVEGERCTARKAQTRTCKKTAQFAEKKLQNTLMQSYFTHKANGSVLEYFGLMIRKLLTSDHNFTEYLIKQLDTQLTVRIDCLEDEERKELKKAIAELNKAIDNLNDSEQSQKIQKWRFGLECAISKECYRETTPYPNFLKLSKMVERQRKIIRKASSLTEQPA